MCRSLGDERPDVFRISQLRIAGSRYAQALRDVVTLVTDRQLTPGYTAGMATYNPPQPLWKRNIAGFLDFALAFFVCVYVVAKGFGILPDAITIPGETVASFSIGDASYKVGGGRLLVVFALIVAYFIVLGQTGGTVFQRLFGMKRVVR